MQTTITEEEKKTKWGVIKKVLPSYCLATFILTFLLMVIGASDPSYTLLFYGKAEWGDLLLSSTVFLIVFLIALILSLPSLFLSTESSILRKIWYPAFFLIVGGILMATALVGGRCSGMGCIGAALIGLLGVVAVMVSIQVIVGFIGIQLMVRKGSRSMKKFFLISCVIVFVIALYSSATCGFTQGTKDTCYDRIARTVNRQDLCERMSKDRLHRRESCLKDTEEASP